MSPTFNSTLPCPKVDLPSGAEVRFVDHEAKVTAAVAKELREHASDPELAYLGITSGSTPAAEPTPPPTPPAGLGQQTSGAPDSGPVPDDTPPDYDAMNKPDLEREAANRMVKVEGTGKRGAITADDIRKALRAADQAEADVGNPPTGKTGKA